MKTTEFIQKYKPCNEGAEFARQFETMAEVWRSCKRPDWLFWILEKHAPLEKPQSVNLAIHFAEAAIGNWENKADQRPALAIQAAKTWLENPTEENQAAARSAAKAAWAAAWAADAAARAAAKSAVRAADAAWAAAEEAAEEVAWEAGRAAEEAWEAAWAAAWVAAEEAAEAAGMAAEEAAEAAAEEAAEAACAAACDTIRQFIPNPF
jgi:hypothetical protein